MIYFTYLFYFLSIFYLIFSVDSCFCSKPGHPGQAANRKRIPEQTKTQTAPKVDKLHAVLAAYAHRHNDVRLHRTPKLSWST